MWGEAELFGSIRGNCLWPRPSNQNIETYVLHQRDQNKTNAMTLKMVALCAPIWINRPDSQGSLKATQISFRTPRAQLLPPGACVSVRVCVYVWWCVNQLYSLCSLHSYLFCLCLCFFFFLLKVWRWCSLPAWVIFRALLTRLSYWGA